MSSTEPSADTLQPSSIKPDICFVYNSSIKTPSKEADQAQMSSLSVATSKHHDSSQQGSHTLVDLDDRDQNPCQVKQDDAEGNVFDASTELEQRTESRSMSPKSALSQADKTGNQQVKYYDVSTGSSLEALKDDVYLDPTPKTPRHEKSPPRNPANAAASLDDGSSSEIKSIMDQFDEVDDNDISDETGQLNLGAKQSLLRTPIEHPPRRSSLEPLRPRSQQFASDPASGMEAPGQGGSSLEDRYTASPMQTSRVPQSVWLHDTNIPSSPSSSTSLPKNPPPEPDPEPDLPFDFHRFLEQLRHRTADPVAKFLRSFLIEFGKKQWMVYEQVKIINDFLTFITNKMAQCEVWRGVSDAEFDNAREGMEKLVMNRLYSQTFSPAIPPPAPVQATKGKKKLVERAIGPGRKGQHQEDIERDEVLAQKVRIYGWVQEKHLDIPPVDDSGKRFLILAQQGEALLLIRHFWFRFNVSAELLKIKTYRAPRDKIICVLNCCKVIFGETGVDLVRGE